MAIQIIRDHISRDELRDLAKRIFGNFVKAVVDVEQNIMAIGGELHADEEAILLENGARQEDLWGINLYPEKFGNDFIEFNSMINIRLLQGNRSRDVENEAVREKIRKVVRALVLD